MATARLPLHTTAATAPNEPSGIRTQGLASTADSDKDDEDDDVLATGRLAALDVVDDDDDDEEDRHEAEEEKEEKEEKEKEEEEEPGSSCSCRRYVLAAAGRMAIVGLFASRNIVDKRETEN